MDPIVWQEANEALDKVHQISQILDTGLDKETLNILIALCESGVNPEVIIPRPTTGTARLYNERLRCPLSGFGCGGEGIET